jgi:adenylate cyclase
VPADTARDAGPWDSPGRGRSTIHVIADAVVDEQFDIGGQSSPEGAITLLLTDIERAEELLEQLGELEAGNLLRDHNALVNQLVDAYGGEIVRAVADGFLVRFVSANSAVRCALDLRSAFAELPLPSTQEPLRIRIGLHTGHIIAADGSMFGRNVVLAARIADHGKGGEILVSSALKAYTENDLSYDFEDLGEVRFKGVARDHRIYSIRWRSERSG